MVDAAASFDGNRVAANEAPARAPASSRGRLTAAVTDGTGLAGYAEFCASALFAPAQSASWVSNWAAKT
ncbi:MAG: GNAT family N-acetyltransferase, partial [Mesorhizobium sp.]